MRKIFIISLFTIASCSTTKTSQEGTSRGPGSVETSSTCNGLAISLINANSSEVPLNKKMLVKKGIIRESDLKLLEQKLILASLPDKSEEIKQMEVSYLLIKKKYPHFEEEQIIAHYQLLRNFCGM